MYKKFGGVQSARVKRAFPKTDDERRKIGAEYREAGPVARADLASELGVTMATLRRWAQPSFGGPKKKAVQEKVLPGLNGWEETIGEARAANSLMQDTLKYNATDAKATYHQFIEDFLNQDSNVAGPRRETKVSGEPGSMTIQVRLYHYDSKEEFFARTWSEVTEIQIKEILEQDGDVKSITLVLD